MPDAQDRLHYTRTLMALQFDIRVEPEESRSPLVRPPLVWLDSMDVCVCG